MEEMDLYICEQTSEIMVFQSDELKARAKRFAIRIVNESIGLIKNGPMSR
jgi:hypothetical protein